MMAIITVSDPAAVLLGTHHWRDHLWAGLERAAARLYGRHF